MVAISQLDLTASCDHCYAEPCRCDDPDLWLERDTSSYHADLMMLVRKATRSDEYADLAGEVPTKLRALKAAAEAIAKDIETLLGHEHEWNDSDYCSICGADGRA